VKIQLRVFWLVVRTQFHAPSILLRRKSLMSSLDTSHYVSPSVSNRTSITRPSIPYFASITPEQSRLHGSSIHKNVNFRSVCRDCQCHQVLRLQSFITRGHGSLFNPVSAILSSRCWLLCSVILTRRATMPRAHNGYFHLLPGTVQRTRMCREAGDQLPELRQGRSPYSHPRETGWSSSSAHLKSI
jgi:hypothetical protein